MSGYCGGSLGRERDDRGDNPVTTATLAAQVTWMLRIIGQRLTQQLHPLCHGFDANQLSRPDTLHELGRADHIRRRTCQGQQQVERELGNMQLDAITRDGLPPGVELHIENSESRRSCGVRSGETAVVVHI